MSWCGHVTYRVAVPGARPLSDCAPPSTDVLDVQRSLCGHGLWEGNRVLQGQREAADRREGGGDGNYADKTPHPFTPYSLVAMATGPSCRTALEVAVGGCRGPAEIKETAWNQ